MERTKKNEKVLFQILYLVSKVCVLGFVLCVGDFSWTHEVCRRLNKVASYDYDPRDVMMFYDEKNQRLKEWQQIAQIRCTPKDYAAIRGFFLLHHVMRDEREILRSLMNECGQSWISNWHPKNDFEENYIQSLQPEQKQEILAGWYEHDVFQAIIEFDNRGGEVLDIQDIANGLKKISWFLLKWYFLFRLVAPFSLVMRMLFYHGYSVREIKEEVILNSVKIVCRVILWPFDDFIFEDIQTKVRRYLDFERHFLETRSYDYRLTEQDKNAIWLQVMEPTLKFDEAVQKVLSAPSQIRKPLLARIVVWIIAIGSCGLNSFSSSLLDEEKLVQVHAPVFLDEQAQEEIVQVELKKEKSEKEIHKKIFADFLRKDDQVLPERQKIHYNRANWVHLHRWPAVYPIRAPPLVIGAEAQADFFCGRSAQKELYDEVCYCVEYFIVRMANCFCR